MPAWSLAMSTSQIPPYIPVPPAAQPIPAPSTLPTSAARSLPPFARRAAAPAPKSALPALPSLAALPSMPSMPALPALPSTGSVAHNVSDLVLGSLLPPNLPKLPGGAGGGGGKRGAGVRELSTRKEALGVNVMSNNFRRFVTRVGPLFWLQDRVEEVLFWRKPKWTWLWMLTWTFICFNPRALLALPSLSLLVVLLHALEVRNPLPSLLGAPPAPPAQATPRIGGASGATTTTTTAAAPAGQAGGGDVEAGNGGTATVTVPPTGAESNVDYFMNLQAIQNLMGLVSDAYDAVAPRLTVATTSSPTAFPLTPTHLALLLLPPALLLPLTPAALVPYLLVPLGVTPPMLFHPAVAPHLSARSPAARGLRRAAEDAALDDALDDETAAREVRRVEVWENERLDGKSGAWGAKWLRPGERHAWAKIRAAGGGAGVGVSVGEGEAAVVDDGGSVWDDEDEERGAPGAELALKLRDGWAFVRGEDWRVDVSAGDDDEGWIYLDDTWSLPAEDGKRATRRRRWYRRVCR